MVESLPEPLQKWAFYKADLMGLPGPDSYIKLLVHLDKQRHDLHLAEVQLRELNAA